MKKIKRILPLQTGSKSKNGTFFLPLSVFRQMSQDNVKIHVIGGQEFCQAGGIPAGTDTLLVE